MGAPRLVKAGLHRNLRLRRVPPIALAMTNNGCHCDMAAGFWRPWKQSRFYEKDWIASL
jgi:hypothetical protein